MIAKSSVSKLSLSIVFITILYFCYGFINSTNKGKKCKRNVFLELRSDCNIFSLNSYRNCESGEN